MEDDVVPRSEREKALIDAVRKAENQDELISRILKVCCQDQLRQSSEPHPGHPYSAF